MGFREIALAAAFAVALSSPASAKTLVYCSEGSPENFNPQLNTTGTSFDAAEPVYNRLVEFKPGSTEVQPALAESWEISPDGTIYTFHLRHGVKFHSSKSFTPTRDFDADDVMFSIERQWKPDNPFHNVSGGTYYYFADMAFPELLKSVDRVDDYAVRITLTRPNAPFLTDLAMDFATILSAEYAQSLSKAGKPELIDQEPIGTGPFQFLQYQKDSLIRYRKFADYWGPKAKVDALVFAITTDPSVRLAKLRAGECQIAAYPSPADLPAIKADPKLQLLELPGLNVGFVAFNVTKKPFDDPRVRRAVSMAIDKQAILSEVYQSAGEPAATLLPPTMWAHDPDIQAYPHDLDQAKKLLTEAGVAGGFTTDLWAMPVQRPYNPDARRIAELIQADLAKLDIKVNIVSYEWGEYLKRINQGEHMMAEVGWTGDNGDPDNFLTELMGCAAARPGGSNPSKWCDHGFDALIGKAVALSDQKARLPLYLQAQVMLHDAEPVVPLAHSRVFLPMLKTVHGYVMSPFDKHQFDQVELD